MSILFTTANAQDYFLSGKGPFDPDIPSPEAFLDYPIGSHHTRHDQIVAYFDKLATVSDKATFYQYGQTYELRKLINLTITSPENHAIMDQLKSDIRSQGDTSRPGKFPSLEELAEIEKKGAVLY